MTTIHIISFEKPAKRICIKILMAGVLFFTVNTSMMGQLGLAFGIKGGYASTSFRGTDIGSIKSNNNWVAGLFLNLQLMSSITLQPELLISQKGASQTQNEFTNGISIKYVEIPLLVKFRKPLGGVFFPFIVLGPDFGFKVNSKFSTSDAQTGAVITSSTGDFKSADVNGIIGAGADIQLLGLFITIDGRYNFGLSKVSSSNDVTTVDVRNKGFTIAAGIGLRF